MRRTAVSAGVVDTVAIVGPVNQNDIRSCLAAADVLASPRAVGSNTPLKIFSYMHSGKPIVATRIAGHAQVLDDDSATLVEPTAQGLAAGLSEILAFPEKAAARADVASSLAESRYSITAFLRDVADAYLPVGGKAMFDTELSDAADLLNADLIPASR